MGELERWAGYIFASLFNHLVREVGWWRAVLIAISISVILLFGVSLARLFLSFSKILVRKYSPFSGGVRRAVVRPTSPPELRGLVALCAISSAGTFLGLLDMRYSFYIVLRLVVCLTSVVAFSKARRMRLELWQWIFGAIAALYNPFLPVQLGDKDLWIAVNLLTISLFWIGKHKIAARISQPDPSLVLATTCAGRQPDGNLTTDDR